MVLMRSALVALVAACLLPTTALANPPSPLLPGSPGAESVSSLFWIVFWIAAIVFVLVEGLLIFAIVRYRQRRDDDVMPVQIHGNVPLELTWTIIPALIVVLIFVFSWQSLDVVTTIPGNSVAVASADTSVCYVGSLSVDQIAALEGPNVLEIEVIGHQYWWEFRYPQFNFETASEIYVPVGRVVRLNITSSDVIHSWWIPQLGGKWDATPGNPTEFTWFQPTREGVFEGQCAEFCGDSHPYMPARVHSVSEDAFLAWVQAQQAEAFPPSGVLAQRGEELFLQRGCAGCHAIAGTDYKGQLGPDLTHYASRGEVAGMLPNTPEHLRRWLLEGEEIKPGNLMSKAIRLSEEDAEALVAYLQGLR